MFWNILWDKVPSFDRSHCFPDSDRYHVGTRLNHNPTEACCFKRVLDSSANNPGMESSRSPLYSAGAHWTHYFIRSCKTPYFVLDDSMSHTVGSCASSVPIWKSCRESELENQRRYTKLYKNVLWGGLDELGDRSPQFVTSHYPAF